MRSTTRWASSWPGCSSSSRRGPTSPTRCPGTKPLTMQGDIASTLVDGVDRFLLRKTEESVAKRPAFWKRDALVAEVRRVGRAEPRAARSRSSGCATRGVPFDAPELVGTTARPALVGRGEGYEVFAVRWPAFGDVHGEGLLLVPTGQAKVADVVAIPDADQTPEQIAGLAEGVAPESQFARRLAESGCRVLVPVLIDRKVEPRNGRAKLTNARVPLPLGVRAGPAPDRLRGPEGARGGRLVRQGREGGRPEGRRLRLRRGGPDRPLRRGARPADRRGRRQRLLRRPRRASGRSRSTATSSACWSSSATPRSPA